jgi:hypothetical protein
MDRSEAYRQLVQKRKTCSICDGLSNPSSVKAGRYDSDEIGPWSRWQANLDSDVLIVGQDWGGVPYFLKWKGRDKPSGNPTNENLQMLLNSLGFGIAKPCDQQNQVVFLTNLILCLKARVRIGGGLHTRKQPG